MYWCGSTTGGRSVRGAWKDHHRQRMVALATKDRPIQVYQPSEGGAYYSVDANTAEFHNLFDVHFIAVIQCTEPACREQKDFFKVTERESEDSSVASKFALDLDGNAFSGRYYHPLKSGSVVFKATIFKELA
ncbi:hypothetical protein EX30DRAFT_380880 [Ascodesmis nigricans]|uniref:Uncharacterized protein n=1 Tax=Ascodesmis nigricans TaxID=341454 RepID=A0A4S2N369_9PEZI|nr:hypothetical protein EX30DRAFT_380880 [Ascodesmis nigricans]